MKNELHGRRVQGWTSLNIFCIFQHLPKKKTTIFYLHINSLDYFVNSEAIKTVYQLNTLD